MRTDRRHGVEAVGNRGHGAVQADLVALQPVRIAGAVLALVVQQHQLQQLRRDAGRALEDLGGVDDMHLRHLGLRRGERAFLLQYLGRQPGLADVLQQAEQAEHLELLTLQLQEAREHDHVERHLQRPRVRGGALLTQPRDQQHGVGVADHAVGEARDRLLDLFRVEHRARAAARRSHRLEQLVDPLGSLLEERLGDLELVLDPGLLRIRGIAADLERGGRGSQLDLLGRLGARRVDEHVLAEFFQRSELHRRTELEPLVHERGVGPRPVELGDIHAELELFDRDLLAFHGTGILPATAWQATPSTSAGCSRRQSSCASGQRGWNVQPEGGASGLGTSPPTGVRALPLIARSGTASSSMRV
jgi:hypothetical protein